MIDFFISKEIFIFEILIIQIKQGFYGYVLKKDIFFKISVFGIGKI
jgi:hypothetical protein